MKLFFTLLFVISSTQYFGKNTTRRFISDDNFNYTFYVTDKKVDSHNNLKEYHWFKTGKIYTTTGGSDGEILHGTYKKTYVSRNLAEVGDFKYGLKNDIWKNWYQNGKMKMSTSWKHGVKSGVYKEYAETGDLSIKGRYKNSKKHGRWVFYKNMDSDTLYFKRGEKVVKEELDDLEEPVDEGEKVSFINRITSFFKNLFTKKTEEEKQQIEREKEAKKKKKELDKKRKELANKKKKIKKKKESSNKVNIKQ